MWRQLPDVRLSRRSRVFPFKTTQCCKGSVRTNSSQAVGALRAVTQTALTLELVQQLGSGCRAFAFPLRFAPQVLCVAAHQVPSNTRRHSLNRRHTHTCNLHPSRHTSHMALPPSQSHNTTACRPCVAAAAQRSH